MNSQTVVFDLDDVLGWFNRSLCRRLAVHLEDPAVIDDHHLWDQYELDAFYPQITNFQAIFKAMEDDGEIADVSPKLKMIELVRHVRSLGHRAVILTARGWMDDGVGVTNQWLRSIGLEVDELIVTPYRLSKRNFIPRDTWMYFDDNGQHAIDCAPHCVASFLIDKPWNRNVNLEGHRNVYRIKDPDDMHHAVDIPTWFANLERAISTEA